MAPSCPMDSAAKQNRKLALTKILKILGKLRKVIKLGEKILIKLVNDYFSGNSR